MKGNKKSETERFLCDLLLQRLHKLGLKKPNAIVPGDRPDLTLHFSSETVGLEVTRSVYQEYVRGGKLRSRFPHSVVTTTHLIDREPRRSDTEILRDLFDLDAEWKDASQDLEEWKEKLRKLVGLKRKKLNEPGFRRYDRDWLLVYDEPAYEYRAADALCFLRQISAVPPRDSSDFHEIFLLSGKFLFACHQGTVRVDFDEGACLYALRQ